MRHLPTAPSLFLLAVLVLGSVASPLFVGAAAAYGEHVYEANPLLGPGDPYLAVFAQQTIAQSFTPNATFSLLNVTLRLRNVGTSTNTITIAIRPDDPVNHTPGATSLATALVGTLDGAPPANVSIVFSPAAVVTAGDVYWIVASNGATQSGNGYRWYHSNADAYPGGHADLYNATAGTWASLVTDLYFVTYGREFAATLSPGMTADRSRAQPQDFVNFTLYYNNSGTQATPKIWINDSLPSSLSYVSDSSPPGSLVSTPPVLAYVLTNVSNGPHSFRVLARVNIGTPPATVATNRMTLAYVNGSAGVRSGLAAQTSVTIGLATKQLYLSQAVGPPPYWLTTARPTGFPPSMSQNIGRGGSITYGLTPLLAKPFQTSNVTATLWVNTASGKSNPIDFNVSVLDNGAVVGYQSRSVTTTGSGPLPVSLFLPIMNYTFAAGHAIQLRVFNDPSSAESMVVASNATGTPSRVELVTETYVDVTSLSLQDASGPASYWTPMDTLVIVANVSDPLGSAKILGVWVNVTAPMAGITSLFLSVPVATDVSNPSAWKLFRTTYTPALENGTYRVLVTGVEDNGVRDFATADAKVRAPAFTFTKLASVVRAKAGDRFAYYLWFNNTGTGPAGRVWTNDSLPSQLMLQSSNSTPAGTFTGPSNWTWSSVGVGAHELVINVSVGGSVNQVAWIRNTASLVFTDEKGHRWPGLGSSADVAINGPIVDLTLSPDPPIRVHTNQTVVYTVNLTNTGDPAQTVWLNDTIPAGFTFVGSTASTYGGTAIVAGDEILFQFSGMPRGTAWSFTFTLRAGQGMPLGSVYRDVLGLNYTSLNSVLMPARVVVADLVSSSPQVLNATIDFTAALASPAETVPLTVAFTNSGNEPARYLWVNLTMDGYLSFRNASRPSTYIQPDVGFSLANVTAGLHTIFLNVTVSAAAPDRYVAPVRGMIRYSDEIQNYLPVVTLTQDQVTVSSPSMALSVTPGNTTVESGTSLTYSVYMFNAGSGTAADVWLNMTLGFGFDLFGDTSNVSRIRTGANYSWHWTGLGPGPLAFEVYITVRSATPDGTQTNVSFRLDYQDVNHVPGPRITTIATVKVVAPDISLTLRADPSEILPGDRVTLSLLIHNRGETSARWVAVTNSVDSRLEILTYASSVPATGNQSLTWNLTDVAPGDSEWINLTVRASPGIPVQTQITDVFEARYSNSLGGPPLGYVRWSPATIKIVPDFMGLVWIGLAGLIAAPTLALVVARRQRVAIEEVFLVYRDGVLLSHLSRTLMPDKDEDVLSAMLTAVQEFVRDAFRYGEHRELHQMDFGDYRILIERGKLAYLAVVYSGKNQSSVRKKVRSVLDRIEAAYATVLENWDGDMEKVVGARDIIRDYLLKSNSHGRATNEH